MAARLAHEDLDVRQMAEAELARLQRQCRIMEGDRRAYSELTRHLLAKQREMVRVLERERAAVAGKLSSARADQDGGRHSEGRARAKELLALADKHEASIRAEKAQVAELEVQIQKLEKEILELKKTDVSDRQSFELSIESQKNIKSLENRLGVATVKFNKMLADNSAMREEIDHLLKERGHYNQLQQRLTARLAAGKRLVVDLIEQATLAYDQREEAQSKLQALKERGRTDVFVHSQEMRELQRQLDHDSRLQEFLSVKGQTRVMADLEERERQRKQSEKEAQEQMIATYQEILRKIKECCNETDVEKLSAHYAKQEEENFTIFNYVNELNNELEVLQDQAGELQKKIDEHHAQSRERASRQRDSADQLRRDLGVARRAAEDSRLAAAASEGLLARVLRAVENVFNLVRCDNAPVLQLLGHNSHVTSHNVMLYLGVIECRISDLVRLVAGQRQLE
ncbi:outer dynein arm-docking complex subunit 1 [Bacillus rossius redtenbacheri]|uniref:outer dynein arm-docking complex subunit 1 n=1 Tax=Bacillus rossius redtenbacheri TaxID=93214 RepID=UPI002FDE292C